MNSEAAEKPPKAGFSAGRRSSTAHQPSSGAPKGRRSARSLPTSRLQLGPVSLAHPLVDASGTFDLLEYAHRYDGDYFADFPTRRTCLDRDGRRAHRRPGAARHRDTGRHDQRHRPREPRRPRLDRAAARVGGSRRPVIVSVGGRARMHGGRGGAQAHLAAAPAGAAPRIEGYELNVSCLNVSSGSTRSAPTRWPPPRSSRPAGKPPVASCWPSSRRTSATSRRPARPLWTPAPTASRLSTPSGQWPRPADAQAVPRQSHGRPLRPRNRARSRSAWSPRSRRRFPDVPLVGMGGVMTGQDALEFIACSTTAVAVGAANFTAFEAQRILADSATSSRRTASPPRPRRAARRFAPDHQEGASALRPPAAPPEGSRKRGGSASLCR